MPLAPATVRLIREALRLAEFEGRSTEAHSAPSPFVFSGRVDPQRWAIHPSSLTQAMRDIRAAVGIPDITVHDARRLGATLMCGDRIRMSPYTAGLLLNHSSERGGAAAVTLSTYVHADTTNEKRRALVALETPILSIVDKASLGVASGR